MAEYIRVFKTSSEDEANDYVKKGWDLIDTYKTVDYVTGSSSIKYSLGLSIKEYANTLLAIIKEYEKYGLKDALFEKIEEELDDKRENYTTNGFEESNSILAKLMSSYESAVNNNHVTYYKNDSNEPF